MGHLMDYLITFQGHKFNKLVKMRRQEKLKKQKFYRFDLLYPIIWNFFIPEGVSVS